MAIKNPALSLSRSIYFRGLTPIILVLQIKFAYMIPLGNNVFDVCVRFYYCDVTITIEFPIKVSPLNYVAIMLESLLT